MATLLVSQPHGDLHRTPQGHVERPARLTAVEDALKGEAFDTLLRLDASQGDLDLAEIVHSKRVLNHLQKLRPAEGIRELDPDTYVSDGSLTAIAEGLGGGLQALESVLHGDVQNAFCAIRPPGHHAEIDVSMGFCLINTIAILARVAQQAHGLERVAIIDFDVHHGNGTQDIFAQDRSFFYCSSHQMPLFPGSGALHEVGAGNIFNAPLSAGSDGQVMREAYQDRLFPALNAFSPDLILISAGFDAHARDPLAQVNWFGEDYAWLTGKIMDIADQQCEGRVVSLLEGGYDLTGLADGVSNHVHMLLHGTTA